VKRQLWAAAVVCVLATTAAACGSDSTSDSSSDTTAAPAAATDTAAAPAATAPAAEKIKLGFITKFPVDFFFTLENAAKTWNETHPDVEIVFGQGKAATDDEGEIALIESMISQGVKGIAITPTGPAVIPALDKAVEAGVKVVLLDNDLPDWTKKSSVVATDNLAGGKLAGEYLAQNLTAGDTIAVLEGVPGVPALDDRVNGMMDGIKAAGLEVVGKAPTGCAQDEGVSAAENLLTAHPDVKAIYSACGPPAVGALQAVKNAKIKPEDIVMVGFDASPDELTAIVAGEEDASVAQHPAKIGELGIDTLYLVVTGQTVEPNVDTGTEMVTADNAAQFK
jgi:ABC-type sugar transport system substrate-binding protein